jgi:hypothetical protein
MKEAKNFKSEDSIYELETTAAVSKIGDIALNMLKAPTVLTPTTEGNLENG